MRSIRAHSVLNVLSTTNNYLLTAISLFLFTISIGASIILYQSHKTVCELFNSKMESSGSSIARELALGETAVAKALFEKILISFNRVSSDVILVLDDNFPEENVTSCEPGIFKSKISYAVTFSGDNVGMIHGEIKSFSLYRIIYFAIFIMLFMVLFLKFIKNKLIDNIRSKIVSPIELLCGQEDIALENLPDEVKNIAEKLGKLRESISTSEKTKVELLQAENISKIATQVAHDIRSPLEMLKGLKSEITELPESSRRKIQLSINRIEEITFNLLKEHRRSLIHIQGSHSEDLLGLIEGTITEKNIEFRINDKVQIQELFNSNSYGLFSKINRGVLKSILSNLINNSFESFQGNNGIISIELFANGDFNKITLTDNGIGIASNYRNKLFMKGFTTKKTGNGLGLFNAKQDIEEVGGTIEFESEVGKGTSFIITLPKSEIPSSFIASIDAYRYERIIVLDDDPAFHEVWSKRLDGLDSKVEHIHSVEEMFSKYQILHPKILLLSDFELMDKHLDGIDTILKLGHSEHSVLVTARNEEQDIQDRCIAAGIKLLPKSLVNYVKVVTAYSEPLKQIEASEYATAPKVGESMATPESKATKFVLSSSPQASGESKLEQVEGAQGGAGESYNEYGADVESRSSDAQIGSNLISPIVLIDDDRLVHINWASFCKKKSLPFHGFRSIDAFLASSEGFEKTSRIYIDSDLGEGIKGEVESEKIYQLGFLNLYLATGYEKNSIKKPLWIIEIYSKSPDNIG